MTKNFHFLAGLPRSGTNLLANLLAQNPRIHASSPGGVLSVLHQVRGDWTRQPGFRTAPDVPAKLRVFRGILEAYYAGVAQPVIIDRSLGWLNSIELAETIVERPARFLVCVRDLRDILATFEWQWRNIPAMREFIAKHPSFPKWQTTQSRCEIWVSGDEPVGIAYNQIKDALTRGFRDRLHFVPFEKLTRSPQETMAGIYAFLGEAEFAHDFANIRQVAWEDYPLYGSSEHADIARTIPVVNPIWPELLGSVAEIYAHAQLW